MRAPACGPAGAWYQRGARSGSRVRSSGAAVRPAQESRRSSASSASRFGRAPRPAAGRGRGRRGPSTSGSTDWNRSRGLRVLKDQRWLRARPRGPAGRAEPYARSVGGLLFTASDPTRVVSLGGAFAVDALSLQRSSSCTACSDHSRSFPAGVFLWWLRRWPCPCLPVVS